MAVITVPRPLREKLGEEGTDALIALINEAGENNKQSVIEVVAERFERRLAEEIGKLRAEITEAMGKLRAEVAGEISKLRAELSEGTNKLRAELHDLRANLIQWMFVFGLVRSVYSPAFSLPSSGSRGRPRSYGW
jgi:bifunctional DNA-binding transcriptional regulator/antitoxin component of YhaV-PrlF toxin-antitoxin module